MSVLLVPAGNPSESTGPTGNNTYLLMGTVPTLIDAGVGNRSHLDSIDRALQGASLALVLLTHNHADHASGLPRIRERWPAVVVRNAAPDACRDGETIDAGDITLRAVHTPGHSPDHFCFVDESTRDVYCGDLARLGGSIVIPASAGGDLIAYLASLQRVRALHPRRLLPGHGPVVMEPIPLIDEYVSHRRERERQVIEALRSGAVSLEDIVASIYRHLSPALFRAARDSVHAQLVKLAIEGRVAESADGWVLSDGER